MKDVKDVFILFSNFESSKLRFSYVTGTLIKNDDIRNCYEKIITLLENVSLFVSINIDYMKEESIKEILTNKLLSDNTVKTSEKIYFCLFDIFRLYILENLDLIIENFKNNIINSFMLTLNQFITSFFISYYLYLEFQSENKDLKLKRVIIENESLLDLFVKIINKCIFDPSTKIIIETTLDEKLFKNLNFSYELTKLVGDDYLV